MANIINIETSAARCSVALGIEGQTEGYWEEDGSPNAAQKLGVFVEDALATLERKDLKPDAVAVSMGPGSYTGLRIGLSLAKGLCFAKDLPLIAVPTLELLAVSAMFRLREIEGNEIYIPMVDARRMEVYTAALDSSLRFLSKPQALVLDESSFKDLPADRPKVFIGDGSAKFKDIWSGGKAFWLSSSAPSAADMSVLAEKYWREKKFVDVAYSTPIYLKEYEAKKSENKVLKGLRK